MFNMLLIFFLTSYVTSTRTENLLSSCVTADSEPLMPVTPTTSVPEEAEILIFSH